MIVQYLRLHRPNDYPDIQYACKMSLTQRTDIESILKKIDAVAESDWINWSALGSFENKEEALEALETTYGHNRGKPIFIAFCGTSPQHAIYQVHYNLTNHPIEKDFVSSVAIDNRFLFRIQNEEAINWKIGLNEN